MNSVFGNFHSFQVKSPDIVVKVTGNGKSKLFIYNFVANTWRNIFIIGKIYGSNL